MHISLHFRGQCESKEYSNHKSALTNPGTVNKKLQKEISLGRIAGPFNNPPFSPFLVSPIGLVPKKEPNSFRLIHDLSFPKGQGINASIPTEFASVKYETIDKVIQLISQFGQGSLISEADIESAFRILPVSPTNYHILGIKWEDLYYFDHQLPMGASTSCSTFEELSKALQWILQ